MKQHLRRAVRVVTVLSTATLRPVAVAEAAAKIEVGPHNALGTGLADDFWWGGSGQYTTNWDIAVIDTSANGFCAQAKIIADLPAYPDRQYSSPRVCGHQEGKIWRAGQNESSTIRGVKVQVCRVHSDGSGQHCETKQYISK